MSVRDSIDAWIALDEIPEHMRAGLLDYIERGYEPGGFIWAVLCNDLRGACARADSVNRHALYAYVHFLWNYAPAACWGSEERVAAWIERSGASGGAT